MRLATPLPPGAVGEVGQAARAIVAETGAAGKAAVAAVAESRRGSAAVFLAARQARLVAAADEVVAAAADGSAAALSRPLRRFEALTTALWTVQSDLRPASPPPAWRTRAGPAPGCARRIADTPRSRPSVSAAVLRNTMRSPVSGLTSSSPARATGRSWHTPSHRSGLAVLDR